MNVTPKALCAGPTDDGGFVVEVEPGLFVKTGTARAATTWDRILDILLAEPPRQEQAVAAQREEANSSE